MRGLFAALLGVSAGPGDPGDHGGNPADDRYYTGIGHGGPSWAGPRVGVDTALRVSTVYAAVNLLAKMVASLPISAYLKGRDGLTILPNHALTKILDEEPNRWQTGFDFRAMLMTHLCFRGNAFAEIISGPRGAIDRLEPLHPDRVKVERLIDTTLKYTITEPHGRQRVLLQDEVFHIRSAVAPGGMLGIAPINYAMQTIGTALAAERHGAQMFRNGARPSGAVRFPHRLKDDAFDRFKTDMEQNFYGEANVGKTLILEDGAEFQTITMTADQLQFLQTREFQIAEIARWFDVPLILLHHTEKSTTWGTGVEQIMLAFVRNNLRPWLKAWEQSIRRDLIVTPDLYTVRFDTDELIRGDSNALANFLSRLVLNGVLTRNEARAVLGRNPLPGLDAPLTPSNTSTNDGQAGNGNNSDNPPPISELIGHNGGPLLTADDDKGPQA